MAGSADVLALDRPTCVGIIGGGQLGKMIAHEARRMSFRIVILDPTEGCPASGIADKQIIAHFKDEEAIMKLAQLSDVVTYEIELANSSALTRLEASGYPVRPSPETLGIIQNKYRQKWFLKQHNIPVPEFSRVLSEEQLLKLCREFGYPSVLKACEDSYDGRGNYLINSESNVHAAYLHFSGKECMLEKFVPFTKEISIMVSRNPSGQIESFPVAENVHWEGILDRTMVPARIGSKVQLKVKKLAEKTMDLLKGAGIFGIEMFLTRKGDVMVNEIAPRPHNSGHYTNEACSVSQFEQHLRAILDLPLSKPELLSPATMVNILGPDNCEGPYKVKGLGRLLATPGVKLYLYGKRTTKPRRKLGHITATGRTTQQALQRATRARELLRIVGTGDSP